MRTVLRSGARILLCLVLGATARAEMVNWWPLYTEPPQDPEQEAVAEHWTAMGPFFEQRPFGADAIFSFRPFWTQFESTEREASHYHLLYPLFNYYDYAGAYHWSLLNLVRGSERELSDFRSLEAWPFYLSRQTGDPETSYRALWPVGGTLKNFFGRNRVDFAAWPLYIRTRSGEAVRYSAPWPFVQYLTGPDSSGWALWPLYGHFEQAGRYDHTYALWPFYYDYRDGLHREVPYERFGVLPFYARETAAGLQSESFGWPFFGYTTESDPRPDYHEVRYFYPFIVRGEGEERSINRWMPFYTDEGTTDYRKRWFLWPLLKREQTQLPGLTQERTQFLFFIYRDEHQFNRRREFSARRTYLWPFFGYGDNGEGRRQLQMLDVFGPFFPSNEKVRESWSPFFAFYRYDARPQRTRHSALWNFIVVENNADDSRAVHIGPLFAYEGEDGEGRWEVLKGLIGRSRQGDEKQWTFFWNAF